MALSETIGRGLCRWYSREVQLRRAIEALTQALERVAGFRRRGKRVDLHGERGSSGAPADSVGLWCNEFDIEITRDVDSRFAPALPFEAHSSSILDNPAAHAESDFAPFSVLFKCDCSVDACLELVLCHRNPYQDIAAARGPNRLMWHSVLLRCWFQDSDHASQRQESLMKRALVRSGGFPV
jgi:hypothetical protein